jgi:hypothetical protein
MVGGKAGMESESLGRGGDLHGGARLELSGEGVDGGVGLAGEGAAAVG